MASNYFHRGDMWGTNMLIQSPTVEFHWAGWVATSHDLQRAGWDVSVEQGKSEYGLTDYVQFAIRHRDPSVRFSAISDRVPLEMRSRSYMMELMMERRFPIAIKMMMGAPLSIHMTTTDFARFQPMDAEPTMVEFKEVNVDELPIFKTIPKSTSQFLLDEVSLDTILEIAAEKQLDSEQRYKEFKSKQLRMRRAQKPAALLSIAS